MSSLDDIPAPQIARGHHGLSMPGSLAYSGAAETVGNLVAMPPPPQMQGPAIQGGRRQRAVGLIPAKAGSQHSMILREAPRVRINPADVSKTRASLRTARKEAAAKEAAWLASDGRDAEAIKTASLQSREANDRVAALIRQLAEMEAASASRPVRVVTAQVREPSEVGEEIANNATRYLCLHDGCRSTRPEGWADEGEMRRAHPTDNEMKRAQQCHVFVLFCDAPLDPLDPEGERIGYVAPVGSDGTTVAMKIADVEEDDERDAEVKDLRAQIAELRALVEGGVKAKK